ncbi:DUF2971 domain-containing protein [Butyrivibrio sp. VCD2006]|uniref:DUF2971 domain-containing protein n=1 Tax=Butyrivibrio sp. VCD2006 TaxID=1280664 RepID=UPI000409CB20|nr:DUF2971 domain-containing protein [Butyrivibrio sp. VCD2006]
MPILDYVLREKWGYNEDIEAHLNHLEEIKLEMPSQEKCDIDYYEAPLITVCVNNLKRSIYLQPDQNITHPIYAPKLRVGLDYLLKSIDELPPNIKVNNKEIVGDLEAFFRLKLLVADPKIDDLVIEFFRKLRQSCKESKTPLKSELFHRMIVIIFETADYHLLKYNRFRHALMLYKEVAAISKEEITFEHGEDISHDDLVQINNIRLLTSQYLELDEKLEMKQFYEAVANFRRRIQFDHLELLSSYIQANRLRTTGKDTDAQQKLALWNIANQYYETGKTEIKGYTKRHLSVLRNEVVILNLLLDHALINGFYFHHMTKPSETFKFGKLLANYPELRFFMDLKKVFYTEGKKFRILNKCLATIHYYVKLMEMCLSEFEWPEKLCYYTAFETLENLLPGSCTAAEAGHFSIMNIGHMNEPMEGKTIFEAITNEQIFPDSREKIEYPYVFLKSFTTKVDDLHMWEMYGDRAAGLCVVMDSARTSAHYSLKKVCYLRNDAGRYKAYMEDNDSMSATTMSMINDILEKLAEEYTGFIKRGGDKEKIIPLMQSIAYLFKNASYAHEDEYRILRMEDVDSDEIWATSEKGGKLFVQGKERTYISELIFGPKAENVEDKVPYLQYRCHFLSKELEMDEINIKVSSNEYI